MMARFWCVAAAVWGLALTAAGASTDPSTIAQRLASEDRETRVAAASEARKMGKLPPDLADPIVKFIGLETEQTFLIAPPQQPKAAHPVEAVPFLGDEITLARLKANPKDYINKQFVICGGVQLDDYYNFEYDNAARTPYSIRFVEVARNSNRTTGETAHVYLLREYGKAFSEIVLQNQETGSDYKTVRLRCTLVPSRIEDDYSGVLDSIELMTWQFLKADHSGWLPDSFEGISMGFEMLMACGPEGAEAIVGFLARDKVIGSEAVDSLVRTGAIAALGGLDATSRETAVKAIQMAGSAAKSGLPREWLLKAATALDIKEEPPKPPAPKPMDPEARAASLLRSGQNLEKLGKKEQALGYYRELIEQYPDTSSAKIAREKLRGMP